MTHIQYALMTVLGGYLLTSVMSLRAVHRLVDLNLTNFDEPLAAWLAGFLGLCLMTYGLITRSPLAGVSFSLGALAMCTGTVIGLQLWLGGPNNDPPNDDDRPVEPDVPRPSIQAVRHPPRFMRTRQTRRRSVHRQSFMPR